MASSFLLADPLGLRAPRSPNVNRQKPVHMTGIASRGCAIRRMRPLPEYAFLAGQIPAAEHFREIRTPFQGWIEDEAFSSHLRSFRRSSGRCGKLW